MFFGIPRCLRFVKWSKQKLTRRLLSLVGAAIVGLPQLAFADFMQASANAEARGGSGRVSMQNEASTTGGFGTIPAVAGVSTIGTESFALVNARAELGSLGVEVFARATGPGFVRAEASAIFRDALRVTAPGLPFGTRVDLLFDLAPPNPDTVSVCPTCVGGASAGFSIIDGAAIRDNAVQWALGVTGLSSYTGPFAFNLAKVGDLIQIEGKLTGLLAIGTPFGTGDYSVNLLHTVPFFAESSTPGVTLIAESGHDYGRAVVPLPSSGLLAGCALIVLFGFRWTEPYRERFNLN
jgi:hypothetical protein